MQIKPSGKGEKDKAASRDLIIIVALTSVFLILSFIYEPMENIFNASRSHEGLELDEIFLTASFLAILLSVYSLRRVRELKREIRRREKAEALLREEKQNLQSIFDATPYGVVIIDRSKTIIYANKSALSSLGHESVHALAGRSCHDSICPAQAGRCPILDLGQEMDHSEKVIIRKDGSRLPIIKSVVPFRFGGEDVLLEAFVDISNLKEAEAFIRDILESIDEAFVVVDRSYRILSANSAYCSQLKITTEEAKGRHCYSASHGFDAPCFERGEDCPVAETFRSGRPQTTTHAHLNSEGEYLYVETKSYPLKNVSGDITAAIEIISDVTEKRRLEEQLRHSQKMEAIGTLTGGVAHEFNNVITAVMGFSEFLQEKLEPGSDLRKYADYISSSAHRAARLTEGLLAYSRKQITHMEPTDINEVIHGMSGFLRTLTGTRVDLKVSISETPLIALADSSQVEQVVMNLVTNALEAMPERGALTINTSPAVIEQPLPGVPAGHYALIRVEDTGQGIPGSILGKIFEPFFTTKDVGEGTGLGLAMVYGIIKKHEGHIVAESEPGNGAAFSVYIPLNQLQETSARETSTEAPAGGTETLLIAEDDTTVRELMEHALRAAGYRVLTAKDGSEAVDIFLNMKGEVSLLLFDLSMPDMDGLDAFRRIRESYPSAKVLFISGYLPSDLRMKEIRSSGHPVLTKPISPRDLLFKIRNALD